MSHTLGMISAVVEQKKKKKRSFWSLFSLSSLCGMSGGSGVAFASLQTEAMPDEDAAGYMHKLGGKGGVDLWQRRLFVLKGSTLYYYKGREDKEPRGVIRLAGCGMYLVKASTKDNHFRIKHSDTKNRDLSAETERFLELWMDTIQKAIDDSTHAKEKSGWLFKKDKGGKHSWKKRYICVTADGYLRYYEEPDDVLPKGELDLRGATFEAVDGKGRSSSTASPEKSRAESTSGNGHFAFNIVLKDQTRQFYSESFSDRQSWKMTIETMAAMDRYGMASSDASGVYRNVGSQGFFLKCGWLTKKGGGSGSTLLSRRNWKRRFIILTRDLNLCWFPHEVHEAAFADDPQRTLKVSLGYLDISDRQLVSGYPSKYNHCFKIVPKDVGERELELRAETGSEMNEWQDVIRAALNRGIGQPGGLGEGMQSSAITPISPSASMV